MASTVPTVSFLAVYLIYISISRVTFFVGLLCNLWAGLRESVPIPAVCVVWRDLWNEDTTVGLL